MTMLEPALAFAARGWPVFPANPAQKPDPFSKAPHLPKASAPGVKDGGHWLASAEPAAIRDWWRRWPRALIGFPTGLRTQCVVVDLDPKDVSVERMLEALTRFCGRLRHEDGETGEVIEPAIAQTQSGGLHLYFAWPQPGEFAAMERNLGRLGAPFTPTIGNPANIFRAFLKAGECDPALAHVDVRGEGGYVIAPPSAMADGRRYSWVIPRGEALPPLPARLRGVVTGEFIPEVSARPGFRRGPRRRGARPRSPTAGCARAWTGRSRERSTRRARRRPATATRMSTRPRSGSAASCAAASCPVARRRRCSSRTCRAASRRPSARSSARSGTGSTPPCRPGRRPNSGRAETGGLREASFDEFAGG